MAGTRFCPRCKKVIELCHEDMVWGCPTCNIGGFMPTMIRHGKRVAVKLRKGFCGQPICEASRTEGRLYWWKPCLKCDMASKTLFVREVVI